LNQQPLNILMVLRSPVGGLYRHVIDLSEELGKRGHKIGLIYDSSTGDIQTKQRLSAMQYPPLLGVHQVSMPRLLGPADFFAALKIRSLAKSLQAHILHGHGAKGGFNSRLAVIGKNSFSSKNNVPGKHAAIYTPHGGVLHFSSAKITGKILYAIERFLIKKTNAMIFESAFAKSAFENQIGKISCYSSVVHNGLLPKEFRVLDNNKIKFDFAFVGELRQLKGLYVLLDALVDVKRQDGSGAKLIIAGGGEDEEKIRQQIIDLGLSSRVLMVGVKPALEVFEQARTVILPSLAESLPYVVLEAAAAQKPVLASNVGGISEIFGPTANALLPAGNVLALGKAMQQNIDQPEAAMAEMKIRFGWIEENFSIASMTDAIEKIYREAINY